MQNMQKTNHDRPKSLFSPQATSQSYLSNLVMLLLLRLGLAWDEMTFHQFILITIFFIFNYCFIELINDLQFYYHNDQTLNYEIASTYLHMHSVSGR